MLNLCRRIRTAKVLATVNFTEPRLPSLSSQDAKINYNFDMAPLDLDLDPESDEAEFVEQRLTGKDLLAVAHWLTAFGMPSQLFLAHKALNKLEMLKLGGMRFAFYIAHVGDRVPRELVRRRGLTVCSHQKSDPNIQVWINGADVTGKVGTGVKIVLREVLHAATMGAVRLGNLCPPHETKFDNDVQGLYEVADAVIKHYNERVDAFKNGSAELAAFETQMYRSANAAFANADAALAWILSSAHACAYLQSIPYKGKPLWARFVKEVRTVLDLSPDTDPWISRTLRVTEVIPEDASYDTLMCVTHGGRAKRFKWFFGGEHLVIENESGLKHTYSVEEILAVLSGIQAEFGEKWFPLANNVEKLYRGTEISGLGTAIHHLRRGDTRHAQGASYLGVVLDEVGILEWNGRSRGIAWRLIVDPKEPQALRARLGRQASSLIQEPLSELGITWRATRL